MSDKTLTEMAAKLPQPTRLDAGVRRIMRLVDSYAVVCRMAHQFGNEFGDEDARASYRAQLDREIRELVQSVLPKVNQEKP